MYKYFEKQESDELYFTTYLDIEKYPLGLSIEQDFNSRSIKTGDTYQEGHIVSLLPEEEVAKLIQYLLEAYPDYKELLV